jgi:hypothetical protein
MLAILKPRSHTVEMLVQSPPHTVLSDSEGITLEMSQWHFVHHKTHEDYARTRNSAVRGQWLTAWAVTQLHIIVKLFLIEYLKRKFRFRYDKHKVKLTVNN